MKVSVIVVTLNEEKNILACVNSLLQQKYDHDYEVIVADGASTDKTKEIVEQKKIKFLVKEKGSITACRNLGIQNAKYEYIAFTDADCIAPDDWLQKLTAGFKRHAGEKLAGVGGANIPPKNPTVFQQAIGIAFNSILGSLGSIQAKPVEQDKKIFSISCSNSLYKKTALEDVGMFSEELGNQGEDWDLGAKLQKKGYEVYGLHDSFVWHNFRATPKTFWKNMVFYGDGRMRLMKKHPDIVKKRYLLPLLFIAVFVISLGAYAFTRSTWTLVPFLYFPGMLVYSILIAILQKHPFLSLHVFFAFLVQHFGYALGEVKGLRWFLK